VRVARVQSGGVIEPYNRKRNEENSDGEQPADDIRSYRRDQSKEEVDDQAHLENEAVEEPYYKNELSVGKSRRLGNSNCLINETLPQNLIGRWARLKYFVNIFQSTCLVV
jgi:hypothetical protein